MRRFLLPAVVVFCLAITAATAHAAPFVLGSDEPRLGPEPVRARLRRPRRGAPDERQLPERRGRDARRRQSDQRRTTSWPSGSRTAGTTAARMATSPATRPTAARPGRTARPAFSRCAGGAGRHAADYERATDPWLSFSPNGRLHAIAIGFDNSTRAQRDPRRVLGQRRRDLEHAADRALRQPARGRQQLQRQGDADRRPVRLVARLRDLAAHRLAERELVGARLRELVQLRTRRPGSRARPTAAQSWEPARSIFRPRRLKQTIGNQVEVLPDGTLINGFNLIQRHQQPPRHARLQRRAPPLHRQGRDLVGRDHRQPPARRRGAPIPTTGHDVAHRRHPARLGRRPQLQHGDARQRLRRLDGHAASTTPTTTTSCSPARPTAG